MAECYQSWLAAVFLNPLQRRYARPSPARATNTEELMRAYMGAGPEIFVGQDARYLDFLKTRADL